MAENNKPPDTDCDRNTSIFQPNILESNSSSDQYIFYNANAVEMDSTHDISLDVMAVYSPQANSGGYIINH